MLKFSKANAKIKQLSKVPAIMPYLENKRQVYSLDNLSGWTCPFANDCLSKAIVVDGKRKIKDGPNTQFRCFSASQEVLFPALYNLRKHNTDLIRKADGVQAKVDLMLSGLPKNIGVLRFHVGGDFMNREYFDAACEVAKSRPDVLFYAYTKSLPYWVNRINDIPDNFVLTASRGGRRDDMISQYGLRESVVVFSESEAKKQKLAIDHDDSHAANPDSRNKSFALLIHGVQPKGTEAATALRALNGKGSYGRKK